MIQQCICLSTYCRPTVAGIHGSDEGCYSLALSGGYEDDLDYGVCFTYTGEGDNLTLLMRDPEQQMTSFGPLIGSLQTKHRQNSV